MNIFWKCRQIQKIPTMCWTVGNINYDHRRSNMSFVTQKKIAKQGDTFPILSSLELLHAFNIESVLEFCPGLAQLVAMGIQNILSTNK